MGDIGRVIRKITLEPIPDDIPVPEIVPEPQRQPQHQPDKVPA